MVLAAQMICNFMDRSWKYHSRLAPYHILAATINIIKDLDTCIHRKYEEVSVDKVL